MIAPPSYITIPRLRSDELRCYYRRIHSMESAPMNDILKSASHIPEPHFMRAAIAAVDEALPRAEGGPFGACIVYGDALVSTAHNTVLRDRDATCHAEINAIRQASHILGRYDLSGCTLYSTTEPCPMCFSAIHWARIDRIVYGTSIADVHALGFNELTISNQQLSELGHTRLQLVRDFMRDECKALLLRWLATPNRKAY